jgi:tetratricopeptide (TPR) repeat protein
MFATLLLSVVFLGTDDNSGKQKPLTPDELARYDAASEKAAGNGAAQVKLALWCDAHGLATERAEHLRKAIANDPSNVLAHALLGHLAYRKVWDSIDVVAKSIQNDPAERARLAEYVERRARTLDTADSQLELAVWCDKKGLKDHAFTHYNEVLRLDSGQDAVWRRLGYKKQGGQWVKPDLLAADKQDADRQRKADKQWKSRLERIRDGLDSKDRTGRAKPDVDVADVKDARAVPMIWAVLLRGGEKSQLAAVTMLAGIDTRTASNALGALAVYSQSAVVRGRAVDELKKRDQRDFVGKLISLVQKPFEYEVKPMDGPGSTAQLVLKRDKTETTYSYQFPGVDPSMLPRYFSSSVPFDPFSAQNLLMASAAAGAFSSTLPGPGNPTGRMGAMNGINSSDPTTNLVNATYAMAALRDLQFGMEASRDVQMTNLFLQRKLQSDIQLVERTNQTIKQLDERVLPILKEITGQDLGVEPEKWKKWWAIELGYLSEPDSDSKGAKPTPAPRREWNSQTAFAAGTVVRTVGGRQSIETIQLGDKVLSQNTTTGELSFQPVIRVDRRKSKPVVRIAIGNETLDATDVERFWKTGEGWTMARLLSPGDRIRAMGGCVAIKSKSDSVDTAVFSLEIAQNHDFFVGVQALLVHDAGLVQPGEAPFDRAPDLASLATPGPAGAR